MRRFSVQWRFGVAWATALAAVALTGSAHAQMFGSACDLPAPGDVNGDTVTNVSDVQCLIIVNLWALGGAIGPEPSCLGTAFYTAGEQYILGADINCDGQNNVSDTQLGITFALNLKLSLAIDANQDDCVDVCKLDFDGDGVPDVADCAPYDPRIASTATELCDAINNNCKTGGGQIDAQDVAFATCDDGNFCNGIEFCPAIPNQSSLSLVITEIMIDPSGAANAPAQWVEIFNPTPNDIDLRTWKLAGMPGELFNISGPQPIIIRSGGFAVLVGSSDFETNGGISGNRFFTVIPYTGVLLSPNAVDRVALVNPSNVEVDAVQWDGTQGAWQALFAGMEGNSIRFDPALVQTSTHTIATDNDSAANWAQSGQPWREAFTIPDTSPAVIIPQSDNGSPGGLWVRGQEFAPQPSTAALRCEDGPAPTCAVPNDFDGMACVASTCFNPTDAHPNAGFFGLAGGATAADDNAGNYDAATGCLVYVAEGFQDSAQEDSGQAGGGCGDGRTCSSQSCLLRTADASDGYLDPTTGCYYKAEGTTSCGAGDQCNTEFCVLHPAADAPAAVEATGFYTLAGGTTGDTIGADGCYNDVRFELACDDENGCTDGETCGSGGACDLIPAGGITQAQADQTCEDAVTANNGGNALACVTSLCLPATGQCNSLADGIATGFCAVPDDGLSGPLTCVDATTPTNAASPATGQGCLICDPGIDPFTYAWYPATITNQCFIDDVCYAETTIRATAAGTTGCEACQRDALEYAAVADAAWSPRDAGESCEDGSKCTVNDACDGAGACSVTDDFVTETCDALANAACASATCEEDGISPLDGGAPAECSWTGLETGGTGCFVISGTSDIGATEGSCVANGSADPNNFCQVCDQTQTSQGYSVKDLTAPVYCDADAIANEVTLSGTMLTGDSNPCTVHRCAADGLAGVCQVDGGQGTAAWEDYDFGDGENCAELTCAADSCDPTGPGGITQCRYQHLGAGNSTECLLTGPNSDCGATGCFSPSLDPPSCMGAGTEEVAQGCRSCDVQKAVVGYSDKDAETTCFAGDFCQIYSCGGEVGNEATSGQCVVRDDWANQNCHELPNAGCNSAENFTCISNYSVLAGNLTDYPDNVPPGIQYYLNNSSPLLTAPPDSETFQQACVLDLQPCGTTCLIGSTLFNIGELNPDNQCEWCNPGRSINGWSVRSIDTDVQGDLDTLAAAQAIVGADPAWTFGTSGVMQDFCRADIATAGSDGDVCTVQRCQDDGNGVGECGTAVAWITLQDDYLTGISGNDDPDALCLERIGNDASGLDVSSCVQKVCDGSGGTPQCALEANGGDDPAEPQCFIGDRCHNFGDGNPFGPDGIYNEGDDGHLTAQCALCDATPGDPSTWSSWLTADFEGDACNGDDNGCTQDRCVAGVCVINQAGAPNVSDGLACTTDLCADGITEDLTFTTSNNPDNDNIEVYGSDLGDRAVFPLMQVGELRLTGQSFSALHTIDAARCLIDVDGTPTCFNSGQNAGGVSGFNNQGLTDNASCAVCTPGATAGTQAYVSIDNAQTAWSANSNPLTNACNDGIACTIGDTCSATVVGSCIGNEFNNIPAGQYGVTQSPICNDNNPCTIGRCDATGSFTTSLPELGALDDAWTTDNETAFSGCRFFAAPTVVTCSDGDFCTAGDTCADPGNPTTGGTPGIVGTSAGQCEPGSTVSCEDGSECTFNYCNTDTGGCLTKAVPRYYTGEHDTTALTVPLKLGLTIGQVWDPNFDYITAGVGQETTTTRRCDLSNWCTAGQCSNTGVCIVTDTGTGAVPASNDKCANLPNFDTDDNACTAPRCDSDAGVWTGADFNTFVPDENPDASPETIDSTTGCYLGIIPENDPCNAPELLVLNVCADTSASTCDGDGICQVTPVVCDDGGNEFDTGCRDYLCDPDVGSTASNQCLYVQLGTGTYACDDRNECTVEACTTLTAGQGTTDANLLRCSSAVASTNPDPGGPANAHEACTAIDQCHPVLGWNPASVYLTRIDQNLSPAEGTGLLGSSAQLAASLVGDIQSAAGSGDNFDLDDDGTVDSLADVILCQEDPDDPCTGPDYCQVDGSCDSNPVPHCEALNTNTLCVISGPAGSTYRCPVMLAAGSLTNVGNGDVGYGMQLDLLFPQAQLTMAGMVDLICFAPSLAGCFETAVSENSATVYPTAHTASFAPTTLAQWNNTGVQPTSPIQWPAGSVGGRMILSKSEPERLNLAHFDPPFDPATSTMGHIQANMGAGPTFFDAGVPTLFSIDFTLDEEILPSNPAIVYAKEILVVRQDAQLLDVDVWNRVIVTKTLPSSSADCLDASSNPVANGTPCEDGDPCTIGDFCNNGVCQPGWYIEDQQCEDGEECTYVDTCQVGECVTGEQDPCPASLGNDIACVISGDENDVVDCWLYLAAEDETEADAVGYQFDLRWGGALELVSIADKVGTTMPPGTDPLVLAPLDMRTQATSFGTHTVYVAPSTYSTAAELETAPGSGIYELRFFVLDFTLSNRISNAYAETPSTLPPGWTGPTVNDLVHRGHTPAPAPPLPAEEPMPGAFMRLTFQLTQSIDANSPAWVTYNADETFPASNMGLDLDFTLGNRVVLTRE